MKAELLCHTCGEPLGHCAQNTHYPGGKESGWHSVHVCVNPECERYLDVVQPPKGLGMKSTEQCRKEQESDE
jgi:hypothetical protein